MSVRQYIGARYVTKIYENSLDPSSAEWEQGTFEPLVMVTWQNSTYLSKKQVPGSVGDPTNNPNYWVCTGYYNGQIMQLQNDVAILKKITCGVITPDMFTGANDAAKIQAAIYYALDNRYPTIILDRRYDITGSTLYIDKGLYTSDAEFWRYRSYLNFIAIGEAEIYKGDAGFMFSAHILSAYITFSGVKFLGGVVQTSTMTDAQIIAARKQGCSVFDMSVLKYLRTSMCSYNLLNTVFDGSLCISATTNMQSLIAEDDQCSYCNAFATMIQSWDCSFIRCCIEICNKGIVDINDQPAYNLAITKLVIRDCLIENMEEEQAIRFENSYHAYSILKSVTIEGCYFENCHTEMVRINVPTIWTLDINNNYFSQNGSFNTYDCIYLGSSSSDKIFINRNVLQTGGTGIIVGNTSTVFNLKNNDFHQDPDLAAGTLTNSTKSMLSDLIIYQSSLTTESINGNTTSGWISITDMGAIVNPVTLIINTIVPGSSYDTGAIVVNNVNDAIKLHTNGATAQTYDVTYTIMGY